MPEMVSVVAESEFFFFFLPHFEFPYPAVGLFLLFANVSMGELVG